MRLRNSPMLPASLYTGTTTLNSGFVIRKRDDIEPWSRNVDEAIRLVQLRDLGAGRGGLVVALDVVVTHRLGRDRVVRLRRQADLVLTQEVREPHRLPVGRRV